MSDINFAGLGDGLVDSIRNHFEAFLAQNKDVDDFVIQLGRRYATLAARYHLAQDEDARAEALGDLRRVANTMQLEFNAIAHLTRNQIVDQLKAALQVVLGFAIQSLPTILAMVKR